MLNYRRRPFGYGGLVIDGTSEPLSRPLSAVIVTSPDLFIELIVFWGFPALRKCVIIFYDTLQHRGGYGNENERGPD